MKTKEKWILVSHILENIGVLFLMGYIFHHEHIENWWSLVPLMLASSLKSTEDEYEENTNG